jgi:hypothetical protein
MAHITDLKIFEVLTSGFYPLKIKTEKAIKELEKHKRTKGDIRRLKENYNRSLKKYLMQIFKGYKVR